MSAFPNIYTHRKVADTAAKSCLICFKLSSSVLVTPDKQDFFYVCPSHLKETGFCTPIIDQAAAAEAKKKKELEEEVARVKKEYEQKQRKKQDKEEADKSKDKEAKNEANENKDDTKKADSVSKMNVDKQPESTPKEVEQEEPRVFALHRSFYQNRLTTKRQAEIDKRSRERMQNPTFFPSVPKSLP